MGATMASAIARSVDSEVYRFPLTVSRQSAAWAAVGVLGAALVSALIVRRRLDRLDLIAVLKVRE
jgi:putative ABC transport system permease protein